MNRNPNQYPPHMVFQVPNNIIVKSTYQVTSTSFLQPLYITETIKEIQAYILKTNASYYPNLEIEAKLGCYEFVGNAIKSFNCINEGFKLPEFQAYTSETKAFTYKFHPGLSPEKFYLIWASVDRESRDPKSEIEVLGCHTYDETHYKSEKRKAIIYSAGKSPREETIRKEDKKHINIRRMGNDFRVTCCKEMPSEVDEENDVVKMTRQKFRTSYRFRFYRIDFTIAQCSYEKGKLTYEIEIEIDKDRIQNFLNETHFDQLTAVLERFIQNVVNLYTATTLDGFNFGVLSRKGNKYRNRYGNYLENNVYTKN